MCVCVYFTMHSKIHMRFSCLKKIKGEKVIQRNSRVTDLLHYLTVSLSATPNVHYQEGSVCVLGRQREESMMLINSLPFSVCLPFTTLHFTPFPPPPFSSSLTHTKKKPIILEGVKSEGRQGDEKREKVNEKRRDGVENREEH